MTSLQQQQASESGVSIDEEMSNLIKYENAYQAAARLYTVANGHSEYLNAVSGGDTTSMRVGDSFRFQVYT